MNQTRGGASPPCFAHELTEGPEGFAVVDPETARDVARWRKAERERLIALRQAGSADRRHQDSRIVAKILLELIRPAIGKVIAVYWPFKGELDLRPMMRQVYDLGAIVALPVVVAKATPLRFRRWRPDCRLERGVWNIPVPVGEPEVCPSDVIAPLVGYDPAGYRLGYGGGFYDRTLAAAKPRPRVFGVGQPEAEIPTIFPQPHDIDMDVIITREGVRNSRAPA